MGLGRPACRCRCGLGRSGSVSDHQGASKGSDSVHQTQGSFKSTTVERGDPRQVQHHPRIVQEDLFDTPHHSSRFLYQVSCETSETSVGTADQLHFEKPILLAGRVAIAANQPITAPPVVVKSHLSFPFLKRNV